MKRPEFIVVARCGRPRGVSGELYLHELTDNPERFRRPGTFWMEADGEYTKADIDSIRYISDKPVIKFKEIESREEAKEFGGRFLYIKGTDLPELPEKQYYQFELIGCEVVDVDGRRVGQLKEIEEYPAGEVWVIETDNKKKALLPAVKEFVKDVDIQKRVIVITPPEGIFDSPDEN